MSLKDCLKRGALITAANWHVVLIQFVADALFKTLLAVPIVGGAFLAVLLVGADPFELLQLPVTELVATMASVLLAQPLALAAFLFACTIVVIGGSMLMFLTKGGTVTVLIAADRAAGAIEHPPLRLPAFRRATQFSLERFTTGAALLFPRYLRLGAWLMLVYLASTGVSLFVVFGSSAENGDWRVTAAAASAILVPALTVVNLFYLLFQLVIAIDDVGVGEAARRLLLLLRKEGRVVAMIFGATLALVVLTTMASILATAALGLIMFVPLVGLAAFPLQLIAWLVRGVVFEYIGLTALSAYVRVYRSVRESASPAPDGAVHHIGKTA